MTAGLRDDDLPVLLYAKSQDRQKMVYSTYSCVEYNRIR